MGSICLAAWHNRRLLTCAGGHVHRQREHIDSQRGERGTSNIDLAQSGGTPEIDHANMPKMRNVMCACKCIYIYIT